jgi:transcription elongation GreA/GreB family factor
VTLDGGDGSSIEFTILGAWDSDPDKKILSYLSEIGKVLVGSSPGDEVEIMDLETEKQRAYIVKTISSYV